MAYSTCDELNLLLRCKGVVSCFATAVDVIVAAAEAVTSDSIAAVVDCLGQSSPGSLLLLQLY